MQKIRVIVSGCDDSTIIEIEVSDEELTFIKTLAKKITVASTYSCKPTMQVEKL